MASDFEAPLPDVLARTARALEAVFTILDMKRPADAETPTGLVQRTREEAAQE